MTDKKFAEAATKAHNEYRSRHHVAALEHNKDMSAIAQRWADHLASTGTFEHSKDRTYKGEQIGENIAKKIWPSSGEHTDYTGQDPVDRWYSEISEYDYDHGCFTMETGHFTQVVWKGSKEVGVGKAYSADGKTVVVVCNYRPSGNFSGKFQENVLKK